MKRVLILAAALLLSACSSTTKLGSFAYCAHAQVCEFKSATPAPSN